jgi:hypothetical protein
MFRKLEQLEETQKPVQNALPLEQFSSGVHSAGDNAAAAEKDVSSRSPVNQQILRKLAEAESMLSRKA